MLRILLFLTFNFYLFSIQAQENDHAMYTQKGDHHLSVGVGFPNAANVIVSFANILNQEAKATPEFSAKYEFAITDKIGIGAHLGYYNAKTGEIPFMINTNLEPDFECCLDDPLSSCCIGGFFAEEASSSYTINAYNLGGRLVYHFQRFKGIDTYSAFVAGYSIVQHKELGTPNTSFQSIKAPTFIYSASIGGRYYFSDLLSIYLEAGNSILSPLYISTGMSFRWSK